MNQLPYTHEQLLHWMERAVDLSKKNAEGAAGGPFGAIVVKAGEIVAEGANSVLALNDPTAHAEVMAIRKACEKLGSFQLEGCIIITSCEPCPMCLGAIYWARPDAVYFANSRQDAASIGFDDEFIYNEINTPFETRKIPMIHLPHPKAMGAFQAWQFKEGKTPY